MMDMFDKAAIMDVGATKAKVDSEIITQTLDAVNSPIYSGGKSGKKASSMQESMKDSYDFQKSVLSAVYLGKGTAIDTSK